MPEKKQSEYAAVAMGPKLRSAVEKIAKREGRKLARQASIFIEIGLAEYERQQSVGKAG